MTKTFIYGVPHGFDFFEKDASLNEYLKGFYISSRRGRRLMINRRDNGETIYSYLCYGLKEVDRQPLHSFFGMSLVVGSYQFCPNFKILLEWFDYLFNKLVNEHNIIKKNEDGILHYVIHKFDENTSDVEWLKSNLPNILTQAGQTQIVNYDSSFTDGRAGQMVSFNQPVSENRLLETFKRYRWLSISSDIVEKQEIVVGDSLQIELNYEELNGKLNEYNQRLLPIAVDISKGSKDDLERMDREVEEISTSLTKYLPTINDYDEAEKFKGLETKYDSLKGSIGTLLTKISSLTQTVALQPPQPESDPNKTLSPICTPDATKCSECEEQDTKKLTQELPFDKIGKKLMSKGFLGVLASVIVIAVAVFAVVNLPKGCSTESKIAGEREVADTTQRGGIVTDKLIVKDELENLVVSNDFKAVYEYLADKKDADNYKRLMKDTVNNYLWSIVDSSSTAQDDLAKFYIINRDFLNFIDFGEDDKQAWSEIVDDYNKLWCILKKEKVTPKEIQIGETILAKHKNIFPADWYNSLASKPKEVIEQVQTEKGVRAGDSTSKPTFTLTYTKAADKEKITINIDGSKIGFDGLVETYATVTCKNGKIKENGKDTCTVFLKELKGYTINLNGKIVITITAKRNFNE